MTRFRMLAVFFLITSCLASGALADAAQPWVELPTNRPQFRFAPFGEAHDSDEGRISGWWSIEEKKQLEFDPSPTVVAINWSAFDISSDHPSILSASCDNKTTSIIFFIFFQTFKDDFFTNDRDSFDITYRIDSAPVQSMRWDSVRWGAGIFGLKAKNFLRDLQNTKRIFIQLTDKNGQNHDTEFDLAGIQDVTETVTKACSWSMFDFAESYYHIITSVLSSSRNPHLTQDDIRKIKILLNAKGFNAGAPEDAWNMDSINAIRAFQKQNGLPVTGNIEHETIKALKELGFQPSGE